MNHKISILGTNVTLLKNYNEAYQVLYKYLNKHQLGYITVNNVHTVIESCKNRLYRNIINNSILSLPDGKPLSIYGELKGHKDISRIFGPSFMERTIDWGQKDGLKHFFFGSSDIGLRALVQQINNKYPRTNIVGYYSPPFTEIFSEEDNAVFLKIMNESYADIYWIGLGAPKQEIWMYENYKKLNRGVMIGIGAGFDYLAGNTKHAPEWMKNLALEWVYRLIQEPRRLWRRYLVTNTLFLWYVFLEFTRLKKFN